MKEIELTRGFTTLVDDEDFAELSKRSWCASFAGNKVYACARVAKQLVRMHRYLMQPKPGQLVDHINRNSLDNRRSNLRIVNKAQNGMNMGKTNRLTSSKFKGVFWYSLRNSWCAQINLQSGLKRLGFFATEYEAALAYDIAAEKYFGEFACKNFP